MSGTFRANVRGRAQRVRHAVRLSVPVQAVGNATGRRTLICIGDSHIEPMLSVRDARRLPHTTIHVVSVGGATASGIQNPNSRTNALQRYRPWLDQLNRRLTVLACLGEVDAGYLVFTRVDDPAVAVTRAVERYTHFLEREVLDRGAALIVVTVIPPIIEDYRSWAGPRGQTRDVDATWAERSAATDQFNRELRAWASASGVVVFDLDEVVRDPSTGRVFDKFHHPDSQDHHLNPELHADLLEADLRRHGFS